MTDTHEAEPPVMEGGGFYNRNSGLQAAGIARLLPLWEAACRTVAIGGGSLLVADYGSSQGRNSMVPVGMAVAGLRRRAGPDVPIEVVHTDLPTNDFASLFVALADDPDSYMRGSSGVFPSAIGRSYYEPLLPPGRVHLGWNSWTMQWMSRSPVDAPDHVVAGMSADRDVLASVREQQARDWRRFLELRAREMRPGAKLLSAFSGRTAQSYGWEWLCGELWAAVLDMERAGLVSGDEARRMTIPIGLRTIEEIAAPFAGGGRFAGLELEHAGIVQIPDPYWPDYEKSGDRRRLGERHAGSVRGWSGPAIAALLDPGRDRTALIDELFARFAERVAADPHRHQPYLALAVVVKRD